MLILHGVQEGFTMSCLDLYYALSSRHNFINWLSGDAQANLRDIYFLSYKKWASSKTSERHLSGDYLSSFKKMFGANLIAFDICDFKLTLSLPDGLLYLFPTDTDTHFTYRLGKSTEDSQFLVTSYDGDYFTVLDLSDNVSEQYTAQELKRILKQGILIKYAFISEHINPRFTFDGISVFIYPKYIGSVGRFLFIVKEKGDRLGITLKNTCKKPTINIYDTSENSKTPTSPFGILISSYYVDTYMKHSGNLHLNYDDKDWVLTSEQLNVIKQFCINIGVA